MKSGTILNSELNIERLTLPIEQILILYLEKLESLNQHERLVIPKIFELLSFPIYKADNRAMEDIKNL